MHWLPGLETLSEKSVPNLTGWLIRIRISDYWLGLPPTASCLIQWVSPGQKAAGCTALCIYVISMNYLGRMLEFRAGSRRPAVHISP